MDGNEGSVPRVDVPEPARRATGRPFVDVGAAKEIVASILRHRTPRRVSVLGTYMGLWSTGRLSSLALQGLDELLFPEWRDQEVKAPVFIFATPRSGTTLLHRLLSFDEGNWVGPRLYETVWPSVSHSQGSPPPQALPLFLTFSQTPSGLQNATPSWHSPYEPMRQRSPRASSIWA